VDRTALLHYNELRIGHTDHSPCGIKNLLLEQLTLCKKSADPSGRAVKGVGLRSLACWDCGFESHQGHGSVFLVSAVCCQAEVSATGR